MCDRRTRHGKISLTAHGVEDIKNLEVGFRKPQDKLVNEVLHAAYNAPLRIPARIERKVLYRSKVIRATLDG